LRPRTAPSRHLRVLLCLQMLANSSIKHSIRFTCYDQSSKCQRMADSSVSYATAVVTTVKAAAC